MSRQKVSQSGALDSKFGAEWGPLAHPLPAGMRDLLPAESEVQGRLARAVLGAFELYGYQRVNLPAFEYAEVLQRGLGTIDPASMLRFVEPETGEVVALRPDMTPQLARLVASRLRDHPVPARLSYRGSVLRRQHERARHDQQMLQAGVELVGVDGVDADLEVITVCWEAVVRAGLTECVLDLGHGAIATSLLRDAAPDVRSELLESLNLKDGAELCRRAKRANVSQGLQDCLLGLLSLAGGVDVFQRARRLLENTVAWPYVLELQTLVSAIVDSGLGASLVIDLGEVRAAAYYTGPTFQILAEGPGQAVASGGRYDELYGLFGAPRPAAGGAIQLDHLRWALGPAQERTLRVIVMDDAKRLLPVLRAEGIACVFMPQNSALDYARSWRYSHVVQDSALESGSQHPSYRITRVDGEKTQDLGVVAAADVVKKLHL